MNDDPVFRFLMLFFAILTIIGLCLSIGNTIGKQHVYKEAISNGCAVWVVSDSIKGGAVIKWLPNTNSVGTKTRTE